MKYEINDFTTSNAKRLKDALKRLVNLEEQNGTLSSTVKADKNLFEKVSAGLKKVADEKKEEVAEPIKEDIKND